MLGAGLAACGSSDEGVADSTTTVGGLSGETGTTAGAAPTSGATAATVAGGLTRPVIEARAGTPPTKLETKDLVVGTGDEAKAGSSVTVQYVGALFDSGEEFDASWNRGQPFQFPLGAGKVIKGWDQGVAGMKVGGRRELVIPPDLAYGSQGAGGVIPPNATLVFVVDLVSVG